MSEERLERMRGRREAGWTYRRIGEVENLSHEQVRRLLADTPGAKYARQKSKLVEQWADLSQAAVVYDVSRRNMESLCVAGAVPGAQKVGETWLIYRAALKRM